MIGGVRHIKSWQGILFGVLFIVVGVALLIYAVKTISSYNEKSQTYQEVIGYVIDYDYNNDGLRSIIVEYQVNGKTYKKISNEYSDNPRTIGSEITLKYNPNNPVDAIWINDSTNVILPVFGGIFSLAGALITIKAIIKVKNGSEYM